MTSTPAPTRTGPGPAPHGSEPAAPEPSPEPSSLPVRAAAPGRRRPSRNAYRIRARRWLAVAAEVANSPTLVCESCDEDQLGALVHAFVHAAGDDLDMFRAVRDLAFEGALKKRGTRRITVAAFEYLLQFGEDEDLEALLDVFDDHLRLREAGPLYSALHEAWLLSDYEVVVPRLLDRFREARNAAFDRRARYLQVLALRKDHDGEVLAALEAELHLETGMGARYLAAYGDPDALPALYGALANLTADPATVPPIPGPTGPAPVARHIPETARATVVRISHAEDVAEAIEALGGTLAPHERRALRALRARGPLCECCASRAGAADPAGPSALVTSFPQAHPPRQRGIPSRTGPNAPCPCGSGRKHKKCCM